MRIDRLFKRAISTVLLLAMSALLLAACTSGEAYVNSASSVQAHEHGTGLNEEGEEDREETSEDAAYRKALHMSYIEDASSGDTSPYAWGGYLYSAFTVSGDAIGEKQIFPVRELEELASLSMSNKEMNSQGLLTDGFYSLLGAENPTRLAGLDLVHFLELCGVSDALDSLFVEIYASGEADPVLCGTFKSVLGDGKSGEKAIIAFGIYGEVPFVEDADSFGYKESLQNSGGPVKLVLPDGEGGFCTVTDADKILVGKQKEIEEYHYEMHDYDPYKESLDIEFTINVFTADTDNPAKSLETLMLTTAEMEKLALAHPEAVVANFYGTIGDIHSVETMDLGAWIDYYEGLGLNWLLTEQMGLSDISGRAVFYGRDGEAYAEVEDLGYLKVPAEEAYDYYVVTSEGVNIPYTVPMIAYGKNGYPLLAEHDHVHDGYVDYNHLSLVLHEAKVPTKVGTVKNHSGPFVACLGNLEGYYGGYQVETGGDCVRIDLYLE